MIAFATDDQQQAGGVGCGEAQQKAYDSELRYFWTCGKQPSLDPASMECALQCKPCVFIKKDGKQCRNRVCIGGPYCWRHTLAKLRLRVRPSTISSAGVGVFAYDPAKGPNEVVFKHNDIIIPKFWGEGPMDKTARYDNDPSLPCTAHYSMVRNTTAEGGGTASDAGMMYDAACLRSIASLINHANIPEQENAILAGDEEFIPVKVYADEIRNHDEILVHYGAAYFDGPDVSQSLTTRRKNKPLPSSLDYPEHHQLDLVV